MFEVFGSPVESGKDQGSADLDLVADAKIISATLADALIGGDGFKIEP